MASSQDSKAPLLSNRKTFDDILSSIGFGRYQVFLFFKLGLIGMVDGSETLVLSLVLPILQQEWNLSDDIQSIMGSVVYGGYLVGTLFSGQFADRFGRKRPIAIAALLVLIFSLLSAVSPNIYAFMIFRGIFAAFVGFILPLSFTVLAECTPVTARGRFLTLIGLNYTLGEIAVCGISWITLDNLKSGNWRALIGWSSVPALLTVISSFFFLDESARYEVMSGDLDKGANLLRKIATTNKRDPDELVGEESRMLLKNWVEAKRAKDKEKLHTQEKYSLKDLFRGKYLLITPILWFAWFTNSFVYYGISFVLPRTLAKDDGNHQDDLWDIFISALSEIPSPLVAAIITEIKYLGRKNSLALAYTLSGACSIFIYFSVPPNFIFWASSAKVLANLAFTLNYQFTSELYETKYRATGLSLANGLSGLGNLIMPWIGIYMGNIGKFLPFFIFGVTACVAGIGVFLLRRETKKKGLDGADEDDE